MRKICPVTVLSVALAAGAIQGCATSGNYVDQPYDTPGMVRPNAYGLGVNADQYGRPTTYQLQNGQQLDPIFDNGVKQNAYGQGVGMDQFGRPVYNSPQ
jgi:hypothetical protein